MLNALSSFQLTGAAETRETLVGVEEILNEVAADMAEEEAHALNTIRELVAAFRFLCEWTVARQTAQPDAERLLVAGKERANLAKDIIEKLAFPQLREAAGAAAKAIASVSESRNLSNVANLLCYIPVPPFLVEAKNPFGSSSAQNDEVTTIVQEGPLVIRVMLTLDGKAWANPQILRSNTLYDLTAKIVAPNWPESSDKLVLDYISTLPSEHRRVVPIEVMRSQAESGAEVTWSGHIEFPVGQSVLAEPALIQLRATFLSTKDPSFSKIATIVGYHKLRARISDLKDVPLLSRYRALDLRLPALLDEVRTLPGITEDHLSDFIEVLAATLNYMGICAQQALYRTGKKITESEFQQNLLVHLRSQLGEDVQEAPKQGGGITDIRYRSVTIELKVETAISDRSKLLDAYKNQPTQYSSATGAQLGILCVLDMTKKTRPPAPPQNNVHLITPTLHGFEEGEPPFPVRIAAIVIDGNIETPSSYSR